MRNQSTIKQRATHLEEVVNDAGPLISTVQEHHIANDRRQPKSIEGIREREGGEQQNLLGHAVQLLETSRALLLRLDIGIVITRLQSAAAIQNQILDLETTQKS